MSKLISLVTTLLGLPEVSRTRDDVSRLKRKRAKETSTKDVPTNIQLLRTYYSLVTTGDVDKNDRIEALLRKRSIRSQSGIVPVQVLTKPYWCPGECIFCPNDATMPKSYINTQPGAMRALLNNFDPYRQVYNRLLSLSLTGHSTDKIEMIVLGGTRDVYPKSYKESFIKGLYDACNSFPDFLNHIEIDYSNTKSARYTLLDDFNYSYPESIQESITKNETAKHRVIGLTIETRPEYVTDENCQFRRTLGVTRMEMGIQTLHNDVHDANKRGHDNKAIKDAMHTLRQYGFKISNHYMPGLYTSTPEKDLETFRIAYSTPWIKSDELKFYPTAVIPNTPLYDLYKKGEFEPIQEDDLREITREFKTNIVPPYARIKRLARDFDTNEVVAGANTPNLRQLVVNDLQKELQSNEEMRNRVYGRLLSENFTYFDSLELFLKNIQFSKDCTYERYTSLSGEDRDIHDEMNTFVVGGNIDITTERSFVCLCTRCREMRNAGSTENTTQFLVVRTYYSSVGLELFISFEDDLGYLYGFTRLMLPKDGESIDYPGLGEGTAIIRELHVYGSLQKVSGQETSKDTTAQHKGIGSRLMAVSEKIARKEKYSNLSVISGVGVRGYYSKLGYSLVGTYMVKSLEKSKGNM